MSVKQVSRQTKVLYSSTKGKVNLLETLNDNNQQYLERMAALKNFRTKSKTATTVRTQLQDWSEEQHDLIKTLDKYEKNKSLQMQTIIIGGVDAGTMQAIMSEEDILTAARSQLRSSYRGQIEQVKKFLSEQVKQLHKLRNNNNSDKSVAPVKRTESQEDTEKLQLRQQQEMVISGVCADVLLQLRSKFHQTWMSLREEENLYRKEVNMFQQQLQAMLREDAVEVQNNQLHLEILAMVRNSERLLPTNASIEAENFDNNNSENQSLSGVSTINTARSVNSSTKKTNSSGNGNLVISIPEDDPDLLNLIADITQQLQGIDEEIALLSSKKQEELNHLAQELELIAKPSIEVEDKASSDVATTVENMYESLDEDVSSAQKQEDIADQIVGDNNLGIGNNDHAKNNTKKINNSISLVHPYGGWSQANHETFVKIYRNAELKGLKRSKMLEQLQTAICTTHDTNNNDTAIINLDSILIHEEWYRKTRLMQKKYKDTEQTLHVSRQDAISQAKHRIETFIQDFRTKYIAEKELQRQEDYRQKLHEELETMREERRVLNQQKLLEMESLAEEEKLQLEMKLKQEEEERLHKKGLVEEYQRQKSLMEAEKLKRRQEEQEIAQARLQALILQNKGRVEFRAQQEEQKIQQKRLKEEENLQQEAKRLELLNLLASQVPYYENIQNIESRLDHVTASVKAQSYIPISEEDRLTRGHMPMNSFHDQQIVRDARFRLTEALARAGVQYSEAARSAVARMNPRPHLAIHGLL